MAGKSGASMNWGGFDKVLDKAVDTFANNHQELMDTIGEILVSNTVKRFQDGVGPDGKAWEPSARAWEQGLAKGKRRESGKFGKTLVDRGRLRNSIDYASALDSVHVGSNLKYALIHQKGGTIRPKKGKYLKFKTGDGNWVSVKEVKIPARPYLGVSKEDIQEVKEAIADFMAGAFKG